MRDLASKISSVVAMLAATLSATPTSVVLDMQGFDSAVLLLSIGVGGITFTGTNRVDFHLEHADDDGTGNPGAYSDVLVTDINGKDAPATVTTGYVKSLIVAHASADVSEIGYIGGKRFLRFTPVFGGTHATGTPMAATLSKGHPRNAPAA